MGARLQNVVRDRTQRAGTRAIRLPRATPDDAPSGLYCPLRIKAKQSIVAPTLLDGKRTDEFRRWTVTLGQPANGIGGIELARLIAKTTSLRWDVRSGGAGPQRSAAAT